MSKRTLDGFFTPSAKKPKSVVDSLERDITPPPKQAQQQQIQEVPERPIEQLKKTSHETYAWPIVDLPSEISTALEALLGTSEGKAITNQPHLDLLYFQPLIPQPTATELFKYLRANLPFYRVQYTINRFGKSVDINTPRFTTVFGLDDTSRFTQIFSPDRSDSDIVHMSTSIVDAIDQTKQVSLSKYKCKPRPIPPCLALLKNLTEALTQDTYNFVLVNYYATGNDSISYHSDDERFLGANPAIASYTLGARRDFLLKHKPPPPPPTNNAQQPATVAADAAATPLKFSLGPGDMILMRGETQANWLHSIPKRKGGDADKGRINITMRKNMTPAGTENYYRYNVGDGPVYKWNETRREMVLWQK